MDDIKKKKEQLEIDLLEARSISASATRTVQRLERAEGEGASDDDDSEEGNLRNNLLTKTLSIAITS